MSEGRVEKPLGPGTIDTGALHPLGYALCGSWTMIVFWFSCFVAWVVKSLVLRYGGMRMYVKARPWFLGMILGEFGMAVVWTLISAVTGAPTPEFPWQ
ncbi:MAG TPA: DUF6784 domain-containing protein [Armatimonadota bacterium]|nr:DUF6784 domain-containing protein [Armatimonadota bacterium]